MNFSVVENNNGGGSDEEDIQNQSIFDKYIKIEKIGEGTYGEVYKARNIKRSQIVAIKKIRVMDWEQQGIPSTAIREISILKEISHQNIVRLIQVLFDYKNPKKIYVVFEYMDFDLRSFFKTFKQPCHPLMVKKILWQILSGLEFCHSRRFIHRDIKPQNILINQNGQIKVADFGLARAFSLPIRTLTKQVVTLWYRAPQLILGKKEYGLGVDIWSTGCIFAELILGQPLFIGDSQIDQLFKIFQILGTPSEKTWKGISTFDHYKLTFPKWKPKNLRDKIPHLDQNGLDLLQKMIAMRPQDRISARNALSHPFFDQIRPLGILKPPSLTSIKKKKSKSSFFK